MCWNELTNTRDDLSILRKHSPNLTSLDLRYNNWQKVCICENFNPCGANNRKSNWLCNYRGLNSSFASSHFVEKYFSQYILCVDPSGSTEVYWLVLSPRNQRLGGMSPPRGYPSGSTVVYWFVLSPCNQRVGALSLPHGYAPGQGILSTIVSLPRCSKRVPVGIFLVCHVCLGDSQA